MKKLHSLRGQFLIESFVAISVAIVGLLGVIALLARSLSVNRTVANHYVANNLAAEGIEIIKNRIDQNIMRGEPFNDRLGSGVYEVDVRAGNVPTPVSSCDSVRHFKFDEETHVYSYMSGNNTPFRRCITLESITRNDAVNELRVLSHVSWRDRGSASFEVLVEDHFFNWR